MNILLYVLTSYNTYIRTSLLAQMVKCPWVRKLPWRRKWQPTPVPSPGKSHGRRSLVASRSPWGCKELDTTEQLHFHFQYIYFLKRKPTYRISREGNFRQSLMTCLKKIMGMVNCFMTALRIYSECFRFEISVFQQKQ